MTDAENSAKINEIFDTIMLKAHQIKRENRKPGMIVVDYETWLLMKMSRDYYFQHFNQQAAEVSVNKFAGIPISVMMDIDREYIEVF